MLALALHHSGALEAMQAAGVLEGAGRGDVRGVGVGHRRPDGSGVGAAKARAAARSKRAPTRAAWFSAALGCGACRKLSKKKQLVLQARLSRGATTTG
jgi:hypothetical protein